MLEQQTNNLVRGKRIPPAIHAANTIRVAIRYETEIMRMLLQICLRSSVIFGNRFRIDAAKIWIVLGVQCRHLTARAGQQRVKTPGSNAKERLMREPQFGFRYQWKIDKLFDRLVVRLQNV